ncbi:MAG: hypothetical protein RBS73_05975 [Prolixibacteraceae bacterium]|jgi:hypothetical protein|nr:hypothetical protein [Prolixibacteraceae bacterium]
MKKLMFLAGFAMVLTVFNACQKDSPGLSPDAQSAILQTDLMFAGLDSIAFSVENNRLVFESEAEYQKCLDFLAQLGDKNFPAFEKAIGFESYRLKYQNDTKKAEVFVDDMYKTILNPEMEIIIGNYLFIEKPALKKTFAYKLANNEACTLKSADISSDPIQFSWNDEVFAILNGEGQLKSSKPSCTTEESQDIYWEFRSDDYGYSSQNYHLIELHAKLVFQVTGIFKSIISKFKATYWNSHPGDESTYQPVQIEAIMEIVGAYDRNDESPEILNEYHYEIFNENQDEVSWRPFYGSRRVRCYIIHATHSYTFLQGALPPYTNGDTGDITLDLSCNPEVSDCNY